MRAYYLSKVSVNQASSENPGLEASNLVSSESSVVLPVAAPEIEGNDPKTIDGMPDQPGPKVAREMAEKVKFDASKVSAFKRMKTAILDENAKKDLLHKELHQLTETR